MNTNRHTSGPWNIVGDQNEAKICKIGDGILSHVARLQDQWLCPELGGNVLANARLIAAAPDGLAFAQSFREWFAEHFEDFAPEVNAQLLCLDNEAEAFIAKATS